MCGRYTITTPAKELASYFGIYPPSEPYKLTDDARPSQNLPIVVQDTPGQMIIGHWGYPLTIGGKEKEVINTRAESILEKPFFQRAAKSHRCIILSDGFYEWKKLAGGKTQKYQFSLEKQPMAFAGIYLWKSKKLSDEIRPFFSIITVPANRQMNPIHDRMPVILSPGKEDAWIGSNDPLSLLQPYSGKLRVEVSK